MTTISIPVTKATIVQHNGLDKCSLETSLVGTMWPEGSCVSFDFQMQGGTGAQWILDHFGIEAKVITVPTGYGPSKP